MRLLAALFLLFALGGGGQAAQPINGPQTHYVVPSCHGLAHVPGYEHCHN
jgi:hypothetical protein